MLLFGLFIATFFGAFILALFWESRTFAGFVRRILFFWVVLMVAILWWFELTPEGLMWGLNWIANENFWKWMTTPL